MAGLMASIATTVIFAMLIDSHAAYNVVNFGAKPNGRTDSTQAFLKAWASACASTSPSTVYVPKGDFLVNAISLNGPCKNRISFQMDGTLLAPSDYKVLATSGYWVLFHSVNGLSVVGGSVNGRGAGFWDCRKNSSSCPSGSGARSVSFVNCADIVVDGLTSVDSQMFHLSLDACKNVAIKNVRIMAPASSPNTDGIHLQASTGVTITSSSVRTGDDCISIGEGSSNVKIDGMACGPGHGISIGSLGNRLNEAGVENVTVSNSVFTATQNGVRIKSWGRPSSGFAKNIEFASIVMKDVLNPIIIDQNYCPDNTCPHQSSGVQISGVTYNNIRGTSASQVAVKFDCSSTNPCKGIRMENINLTSGSNATMSYCNNVQGSSKGDIVPKTCF
uniref:Polygalacturonase n=1 Tax=Kalanchoe fedtschenkoi TaxID=63787 RepID=A0A7N0U797_KALFE